MEAMPYRDITNALAAQARQSIATSRREDAARPIGARGVTIDFYDRGEADKPVQDGRWAAWLVRWTGTEWRRTRRLSGPLEFSDALDRAGALAKARDLPRVD